MTGVPPVQLRVALLQALLAGSWVLLVSGQVGAATNTAASSPEPRAHDQPRLRASILSQQRLDWLQRQEPSRRRASYEALLYRLAHHEQHARLAAKLVSAIRVLDSARAFTGVVRWIGTFYPGGLPQDVALPTLRWVDRKGINRALRQRYHEHVDSAIAYRKLLRIVLHVDDSDVLADRHIDVYAGRLGAALLSQQIPERWSGGELDLPDDLAQEVSEADTELLARYTGWVRREATLLAAALAAQRRHARELDSQGRRPFFADMVARRKLTQPEGLNPRVTDSSAERPGRLPAGIAPLLASVDRISTAFISGGQLLLPRRPLGMKRRNERSFGSVVQRPPLKLWLATQYLPQAQLVAALQSDPEETVASDVEAQDAAFAVKVLTDDAMEANKHAPALERLLDQIVWDATQPFHPMRVRLSIADGCLAPVRRDLVAMQKQARLAERFAKLHEVALDAED